MKIKIRGGKRKSLLSVRCWCKQEWSGNLQLFISSPIIFLIKSEILMDQGNCKSFRRAGFIQKLSEMLDDQKIGEVIKFDKGCRQLVIQNKDKLQEVLPLFFKHSNFESFTRQLNYFGFQKVRGGSHHIFRHPELQSGKNIRELKSKRKSLRPLTKEQGNQEHEEEKMDQNNKKQSADDLPVANNNPILCYLQPCYVDYEGNWILPWVSEAHQPFWQFSQNI